MPAWRFFALERVRFSRWYANRRCGQPGSRLVLGLILLVSRRGRSALLLLVLGIMFHMSPVHGQFIILFSAIRKEPCLPDMEFWQFWWGNLEPDEDSGSF